MNGAEQNPFAHRKGLRSRIESLVSLWLRLNTWMIIVVMVAIFSTIIIRGLPVITQKSFPFINTDFFTQPPETLHVFEENGTTRSLGDKAFRAYTEASGEPKRSTTFANASGGIFPAIVGTLLLVTGSMAIALFMGVLSAIYLSEYSKPGRLINWIRLSIMNLAGVPSIVFGLFGFGMFVVGLGWNVSLLSGWFTLAFMVLPIIIIASEESLKSIPHGFREASMALGASKWQTIRTNVLPYAIPGILTSSILGIARVAGETAPIMFTAAYAVRDKLPWEVDRVLDFFFQGVMALPYHIYIVSSKNPQNEYTEQMQYGTALVFLMLVLMIASISILLRARIRKNQQW
jgi:phosphate transport system permease protein